MDKRTTTLRDLLDRMAQSHEFYALELARVRDAGGAVPTNVDEIIDREIGAADNLRKAIQTLDTTADAALLH
jgi:hypothetical protein